ncbi:MAG: hypothetical protein ABI238_06425 [Terrimesophilobacter sp.]
MSNQLEDSPTASGVSRGEDLGMRPVLPIDDVATQPIDISSWILGENQSP